MQLYCSFGWQSVYTISRSQRGKLKIWYFVIFFKLELYKWHWIYLAINIYKHHEFSLTKWVTLMHCFTQLFWYIVSKLAHILIWGKYLWNVYLFQNYNFDDNKIRDRQSLKLPLPSGLQSHFNCMCALVRGFNRFSNIVLNVILISPISEGL